MAGTVSAILWTIGALALLESIVVLAFPNWSSRKIRKIASSKKKIRKAGFFELIAALILIGIAFLI